MSGRTLSYSRPADIFELMREGFLTIEEGREKHRKAGGNAAGFEARTERLKAESLSQTRL